MTKSALITMERHKHLHNVSRHPNDIIAHQDRFNFELKQGDPAAIQGAITDYLIADVEHLPEVTLNILAHAEQYLSDEWILLFYDSLFTQFNALTPIPNSQWSLFTQDVQGTFNLTDPL